jgi:PleD family two-component response regulator
MNNIKADMSNGDILIVDDDEATIRQLSFFLKKRGYKTRAVLSGSLALTEAEATLPDLILLDIKMPGMDGYEVCELLKANKHTRDIPVIFISALDEVLDKVKAFSVGGVDYITKPFEFEEVLARVETHTTIRNLQKKLQEQNINLQK